jgi:hypothetical protein
MSKFCEMFPPEESCVQPNGFMNLAISVIDEQ